MVKNYSQFFYKDKITKPECILTDGITFVQIRKENRIYRRLIVNKKIRKRIPKKIFHFRNFWSMLCH
jgi:hypothetical protein